MPAVDSHLMRARLVSDLGTRLGARLLGGFLESAAKEPMYNDGEKFLSTMTTGMLADAVKVAESFYITPDMMVLAEAAAKAMPNVGPARGELPAEAGFLYLPRPLTHYDVRGRLMNTHAIQWYLSGGVMGVIFWADRDDQQDEVNAEIRDQHFRREHNRNESWEQFPKLQMQHIFRIYFEQQMPLFPDTEALHRWRGLLGVSFETMYEDVPGKPDNVGMGWDIVGGTEENRIHAKRLLTMNPPVLKTDTAATFLIAFFRLCNQSITVSGRVPVDRAARRRARNLPNADTVTVINLRHAVRGERPEGETQVEWSHRWLTRGHWRNQWYGSGDDRHQAPIWISEHIKGPEDKPLLVRDHVTSLSR